MISIDESLLAKRIRGGTLEWHVADSRENQQAIWSSLLDIDGDSSSSFTGPAPSPDGFIIGHSSITPDLVRSWVTAAGDRGLVEGRLTRAPRIRNDSGYHGYEAALNPYKHQGIVTWLVPSGEAEVGESGALGQLGPMYCNT